LTKREFQRKEIPTMFGTSLTTSVWGKVQIQPILSEREANMILENCVTARQTKSQKGTCNLIGFGASMFDVVFDAITECCETRFIAKGE
jgi:hypothetical protein